jgi:hypothetical protein
VIPERLQRLEAGSCCGSGCQFCPYSPKHKKGSKEVRGCTAFDFDSTLVTTGKGEYDPKKHGETIKPMLNILKRHITAGDEVIIFTARASGNGDVSGVKKWLKENNLSELEITSDKSPKIALFYDDRAASVKPDKGIVKMAKTLTEARKDTDRNPTEAQKISGNYRKGTLNWNGLVIKLENPKGSYRSGTNKSGTKWRNKMYADYGYFSRTEAKDGDNVDCFIGPNPKSELVVAIDQYDGDKFDETKFILGVGTAGEGMNLYSKHYPRGWKVGPVSTCTVDQLKQWLKDGEHKKPFKGQMIKVANAQILHRSRNPHQELRPLTYDELVQDRTHDRFDEEEAKAYVQDRKKFESYLRKRLRQAGHVTDSDKSFLYGTVPGKEKMGSFGYEHMLQLSPEEMEQTFFDVVGDGKQRMVLGQKGLDAAIKRWEKAKELKETEYMGMKIHPRIEVIMNGKYKPTSVTKSGSL